MDLYADILVYCKMRRKKKFLTSVKNDIELNINYKSAWEVTIEKVPTSFAGLISQEQINLLTPKTPPQTRRQLLVHCNNIFPKYEINTPERIAMWFAQCGHESQDFTRLREDFHYSVEALLKNKNFTKEQAEMWGGIKGKQKANAKEIEKRFYLGRKLTYEKNGKYYYGRGFIQLTWLENYIQYGNACGRPEIINSPELLETNIELNVLIACAFIQRNNINAFADKQDIQGATRIINGGNNGLEDRQERFTKCLGILKP